MRKLVFVLIALVAILAGVGLLEWRYSDAMQAHIDRVNAELESAQTDSMFSSGLIASLNSMTESATVGREIMETPDYVHTLKEEVLALKVKKAIENSLTVGDAIGNTISFWKTEFNQ